MLTSSLREICQVSLMSIQQLTYEEYLSTLVSPTILNLVTLDPLPGTALLEFAPTVAMACVDHLLGGPGGPQPQRPLSDIEVPLLRGLLNRVLAELRYAFEGLVAVQPKLGQIEYNPQFVQVCAGSDAVVVASFELKVSSEECLATFCLPLATIFPTLNEEAPEEFSAAERHAREAAHRDLTAALENAPIDVSVRFAPTRLRSDELAGLAPGMVVRLGHPVAAPLDVVAAGITFAHAVPGNRGAQLACLIVPAPAETQPHEEHHDFRGAISR